MRLLVAMALSVFAVGAQTCVPSRILPNSSVSDTLDDASCQLSDGTAYAAYRLDLPVRGQIRIGLPVVKSDLIVILRDGSGVKLDSGTAIDRGIEAGSYTVLVNGRGRGQVGAYSLQTVFAA